MGKLIEAFRATVKRAAETNAAAEFGTFEGPED